MKSDFHCGPDLIYDHCFELRNQIQLATELQLIELSEKNELTDDKAYTINSENERIINSVNEYEIKCKQNFHDNKTLKKHLEIILYETKQFLNKFKVEKSNIKSDLIQSKNVYKKLSEATLILKSLIFNGVIIEFKKNNDYILGNIFATPIIKGKIIYKYLSSFIKLNITFLK